MLTQTDQLESVTVRGGDYKLIRKVKTIFSYGVVFLRVEVAGKGKLADIKFTQYRRFCSQHKLETPLRAGRPLLEPVGDGWQNTYRFDLNNMSDAQAIFCYAKAEDGAELVVSTAVEVGE